uniref:Uncharacterized protein n=1 Tax=Aegilops tauschii subsp. strangulata TaxID=200361 RepID=A0A453NWK2_AEGTS
APALRRRRCLHGAPPRPTLLDPVTPPRTHGSRASRPAFYSRSRPARGPLRRPPLCTPPRRSGSLWPTLDQCSPVDDPVAPRRPSVHLRSPWMPLGPWCISSLISQAVSCISIRCASLSSGGRACSALSGDALVLGALLHVRQNIYDFFTK